MHIYIKHNESKFYNNNNNNAMVCALALFLSAEMIKWSIVIVLFYGIGKD